jgi:hypothetical protein
MNGNAVRKLGQSLPPSRQKPGSGLGNHSYTYDMEAGKRDLQISRSVVDNAKKGKWRRQNQRRTFFR